MTALAIVSGLQAWALVGAFGALCLWAFKVARSYKQICEEDEERARRREAAEVVPAFDFKVSRRPVASTRSGRAGVHPADRVIHGGKP